MQGSSSSLLLWPTSADQMRDALHVSASTPMKCQWHKKNNEPCKNPINKANRGIIQGLFGSIVAAGSWSAAQQLLENLSKLVVCKGKHQGFASDLFSSWQTEYSRSQAQAQPATRRRAAQPSAKPTATCTNHATIKSEPAETSAHAALASIPQYGTKCEPKTESRLSSLAPTPAAPPPAHTFIPYGKERTVQQINKAVKRLISNPISEKEMKAMDVRGVVYVYTFKNAESAGKVHFKIGFSGDPDRRMKDWERQCGYNADDLAHYKTCLYPRVERLVHAQLWKDRRREEKCPVCKRSHTEFFDTRLPEASRVIGLWVEWMRHQPYDNDGYLKKEWLRKLRDVDLTDPNCWDAFTHAFGIGSITKVFVAVVVFQLIEQGKLHESDTIGQLLGASLYDAIDHAEGATAARLLSHHAGIGSWEDDPVWIRDGRDAELDPVHVWGKAEPLEYIRRPRKTAPAPGNFDYSNTNYTLLGKVASRRYHWVTDTFRENAGVAPAFTEHGPLIDCTGSNLSVEWTAGSIIASAADLVKFAIALRDGKLLQPESMAVLIAWTPVTETEDMGHGIFRKNFGTSGTWIGHFGGVLGSTGALWRKAAGDAVIAVVSNVGNMHCGKVPSSAAHVVMNSDILDVVMQSSQ
ncbi:hypothetical protein PWT90_07991 [Aphanocladium album]|nr:hypothetical protein PWT90_07991 [Aphanocladium album]